MATIKWTPELRAFMGFVTDFARAVQFRKMYPPNHPFIKDGSVRAHKSLLKAFDFRSPITFGAGPEGFFVGDEKLAEVPAACRELAMTLRRIGLDTISLSRGIDEDEVATLATELADADRRALKGDEIQIEAEDIRRRYRNVDVNAFRYERITTRETKILDKVKERAQELGEDELQVIEHLLTGEGGEDLSEMGGKMLLELLEADPERASELLQQTLLNADIEDEEGVVYEIQQGAIALPEEIVQGVFSRLAQALAEGGGLSTMEMEEAFFKILRGLPPSFMRVLFGKGVETATQKEAEEVLKILSRRVRAKMLMNDLLRGHSDAEMGMVVNKVLAYGAEIADIAELLSRELKTLASDQRREEVLQRLMRVIKQNVEKKVTLRMKALVVEPEEEVVAVYKAALYDEGIAVTSVPDGESALAELEKGEFDLVALEVKLKGDVSGIDILQRMRGSRMPVIIGTAFKSFEQEFEVATYRDKEFLLKPLEVDDVHEAVMRLLKEEVGATKEETVGEDAEEMETRREELEEAESIQKSLLPKELPRLEGFHLAAAYAPCRGVSGDLYDVLPLAEGRFGVFLGDVSGKGISAAMVMVLVRTLFRTSAVYHESARDTLVHLNRLLSREMVEGMFVSAVYLIIDPKRRQILLSCAGQTPPLFWALGRGTIEVEALRQTGMVLGLGETDYFRDKVTEMALQFEPGMGILLYTDGITEAMNEQREEFGEERLIDILRTSGGYEPERILANIYGGVEMFRGAAPQSDDMTVFCVRCVG